MMFFSYFVAYLRGLGKCGISKLVKIMMFCNKSFKLINLINHFNIKLLCFLLF